MPGSGSPKPPPSPTTWRGSGSAMSISRRSCRPSRAHSTGTTWWTTPTSPLSWAGNPVSGPWWDRSGHTGWGRWWTWSPITWPFRFLSHSTGSCGRSFDITSLIAVRVEDPGVFTATHGLLLALMADGLIDGLRVDHPDGLADPRGYLRRLADATGGAWVVAEKILAGDEELPADWPC